VAFIRAYAAENMGDPFRFRLPRFIRPPKKVRGFLKKVAPLAAFLPGLGQVGIAARFAGKLGRVGKLAGFAKRGISRASQLRALIQRLRAQQAMEEEMEEPEMIEEEEEPEEVDFARSYGYDVGDPGPLGPRRKTAAAGPRAKASRRRSRRATRRAGGDTRTGPQKRRPRGGAAGRRGGIDIGASLGSLAQQLRGGDLLGAMAGMASGRATKMRGLGLGGPRRHVNVGNVKALRRSLRRVDGFAKLARKVQKDAAGILRHVDRPRAAGGSSRRGRGHKAGCRCVVCSRA